MVNLSLNKDEEGIVTLTLEYHESTEMELLFDFIRSQASNAYVPVKQIPQVEVRPTAQVTSPAKPAAVTQGTPQQQVTSTAAPQTVPSQVTPSTEAPQATASQAVVNHPGTTQTQASNSKSQTARANSLDDLSDNEVATLIALAQLGTALEETKDILPLLHGGGRFKSRSDDHASIVRYLLRTLISKGLVEDTHAGRELTQLGTILAAKALRNSGAGAAPTPYRWSTED